MKWMWLFLTLALASCSWRAGRTGLEYCTGEALVVADSAGIVAALLQETFPVLPDSEPQFDVISRASAHLEGLDRYRPLIVRADISARYPRTEIAFRSDVYAKGQTVATLRSPSYARLRRDLATGKLAKSLHRQIIGREAGRLKAGRKNPLAARVRREFAIGIALPPIITKIRQGDDFLWLSSADGEFTLNFCFYRSERRDSVMRRNILGQSDSQYMATVPQTTLCRRRRIGTSEATERRGLWQMRGDAMGGSYMSVAFINPADGQTVVAEAFVYAPQRKKRDLMRLAEAALSTIEMAGKQ